MTMPDFPSLTIFGAGKMGGALLRGALTAGWPAATITVIDPNPSETLRGEAAATGFALNPAHVAPAGLLLLAIKPQALDAAAGALAAHVGPETIVVSILAGKRIADLRARLPGATRFVRAMPNTPAAIGRGITGAFATAALAAPDRAAVQRLLATTGRVEWVDAEALIDAVTAVSGSGPAYVFHLTECLARAGETLGLPADLAMRLARATVEGAGELMFLEPDASPAVLRQNVTSPGGTTAAALEHLMAKDGLEPLMIRAVTAARDRARALSG
ncbi:MAG: pyrroline-5-carboxylate reductase [Hyphomicrobiales bacterium]|nr:pyrroline-5-carboxylate reductase [Hyphomicrobiales bacterium]